MDMKLRIDPEYEKLVPPHSKDEYESLYQAIKIAGGLWYPFQVNEDGVILDGMTRFKICQKLQMTIREDMINVMDFVGHKLEERKFVIETNLKRRHLNDFQKSELGIELQKINEEIAKENQRLHHGSIPPNGETHNSNKETAKELGVSERTYERARFIIDNAPQELKEKLRKGDVSIAFAERSLRTTERANTPTPDLPEGKFELIYLDPPWEYDLKLSGAPDYKTMTLEEMKEELQMPAHDDCIMLMWATNPKLTDALELIRFWGFTYKTNIAWVKTKDKKLFYEEEIDDTKPQQGTGYYVKGSHELLLIATRGSPGLPPPEVRIPSVVFAERTALHSEKPKVFYDIIEKYYPAKTKIEMFSRNKRDGWTSWGDGVVG